MARADAARRRSIAGNWKMNLNHLEAIALSRRSRSASSPSSYAAVEVGVLPPFVDLRSVQTLIDGDQLPLRYGAQDLSPHDSGAYTGDISGPMLAKLGCTLRRRRALRAAAVPRRGRRAGQRQGARRLPQRAHADPLRRRAARRPRGRRPARALHRPARRRARRASRAEQAALGRRRLRAGLGDRHRRGRHPGRRPGGVRARCGRGSASCTTPSSPPACASSTAARSRPATPPRCSPQPDVDGALVGGASLDAAEFARHLRGAPRGRSCAAGGRPAACDGRLRRDPTRTTGSAPDR